MNRHPNVALVEQSWNAVSRSDAETLRKIWSPEIVWHATARQTPWSGNHVGMDRILDFLARIGESVEDFDARLDDILISEERVALAFHLTVTREGRTLEADYVLLARIEKDRVVEVWTCPLDPGALAEFWQ